LTHEYLHSYKGVTFVLSNNNFQTVAANKRIIASQTRVLKYLSLRASQHKTQAAEWIGPNPIGTTASFHDKLDTDLKPGVSGKFKILVAPPDFALHGALLRAIAVLN
jgi:hypothetical protein